MHDTSDQAIRQRLAELGAYSTFAPFSRSYYGLIAEFVNAISEYSGVRVALAGLLDVELRHHRDMALLADRSFVAVADLQGLSERHRIGLESVLELAEKVPVTGVFPAAARKLILAQCYYHLRHMDEVVEALEEVVALGVHQPLVHFALGYSRYVLALEDCSRESHFPDDMTMPDSQSFQMRCLHAVGALEDGLSGGDFDIQLYWWMGVILEAAGLTEAAQHAYDKSAALMELESDEEEAEVLSEIFDSEAISEAEVRVAARLLKGRFHPAELWGEEPDDCS
ncbi:MAG: hypothetical protein ACYC63_20880 [Armatimonadota bacterium]